MMIAIRFMSVPLLADLKVGRYEPADLKVGRYDVHWRFTIRDSRFAIHDYLGSPSRSSKFGSAAGVGEFTDARVAVKPIIRPATMTPTQISSDAVAITLAERGADRDRSHSPTLRRAVSSKAIALIAA